jgi:hypothetical protein
MGNRARVFLTILVSIACQTERIYARELTSTRLRAYLHSSAPRDGSFRSFYLRSQVDGSRTQMPAISADQGCLSHLPTRLRGGMPIADFFQKSKVAEKDDAEEQTDDVKKSVDQIPIKWVVSGIIGGLCLLSPQISHVLVLGYGFCYPAYCR